MDFDFLQPVEESVLAHTLLMPEQVLGRSLKIHTLKDGFPELNNVKIAIIGLQETRNSFYDFHDTFDLDAFRLEFYGLYPGNWDITIADFGTITNGASVEDTYFAVQQICDFTYKRSIIPIFIGGSQDITLPMYRAYSNLDSYINITAVDNRFDFGEPGQLISSKSYMSKIILDEPNRLFNFCNLGYQTFYNAQEEMDLLDRLFFESYRLGNLVSDISLVEPVLRDTDLLSIDLKSMKSIETGSKTSYPNGFDALQICAIARYAGLSDRISSLGIFEIPNKSLSHALVAQLIWYFVEGVRFRVNEYPFSVKSDCDCYHVPMENENLTFYKSNISGRWWVEVPRINKENNKKVQNTLLPCTHQDYLDACNQITPERWWKSFRRSLI